MDSIVIRLENVSKQYRLGKIGTGSLKHDLNRWWHDLRGKDDPYLKIGEVNDRSKRQESEYVWALKNINFDVKQGDVIGIIGKNGAGKSTLLKILSRTTLPTTGSIKVRGRIASLLEVGTGFHPELTGRENIFLNGAILGMTKQEIRMKFDEIVDFSGVEKYIDTPVKRYSSGMYVRLAFGVAAHLDPEILIVDEVLAVGDSEFQKKALGRMQDLSKGQGRTVLFVSHNMASIKTLCNKGVLLTNGELKYTGHMAECINQYLVDIPEDEQNLIEERNERSGNKKVIFSDFNIEGNNGLLTKRVFSGENVTLVFKLKILDLSVRKIDIGFSLHNSYGDILTYLYSSFQDMYFSNAGSEYLSIRCKLKDFPFSTSKIIVKGRIVSDNEESDWPKFPLGNISVEPGDFYQSGKVSEISVPFLIKGDWL